MSEEGLYVCRPVLSGLEVSGLWLDPHVTVCYSRVPVPRYELDERTISVSPLHTVLWSDGDGELIRVLLLSSPVLIQRHDYFLRLGASYDFPEYIPHTTLPIDARIVSCSEKIVLGPERAEALNP